MQMCFFSIIMPAYNRQETVLRAISSVLIQTIPNWELLVIDDCSTDNTANVIKSVDDVRIKYIKLDANKGAAGARNVGISKSTGKYISFLDSDDAFDPKFLEKSLEKIKYSSEECGLFWTGVRYILNARDEGSATEYLWKPIRKSTPYLTFLNEIHIGTNSGITIKKEVFERVGCFNENLPAAEDTEFFLRITQFYEYDYVDDVLINIYKEGKDRLSLRFDKVAKAYNLFLPKHIEEIKKHKKLRLKYFYKMMWLNYYDSNKILAREYFKNSLMDQFFCIKPWVIFLSFETFGFRLGKIIHLKLAALKKNSFFF